MVHVPVWFYEGAANKREKAPGASWYVTQLAITTKHPTSGVLAVPPSEMSFCMVHAAVHQKLELKLQ